MPLLRGRTHTNRTRVRRTWCATKDPERLADHLDIFIDVFRDRLQVPEMTRETS